MWRDRTNLFISYRQSYSHHPTKPSRFGRPGAGTNGFSDGGLLSEERRGLMSEGAFEGGDVVIEMDRLPPRWLDIQDEVTDILADVTKTMVKLDPLHAKHTRVGFEDDDVKIREEKEIERLTLEITRGFQNCQKAIRRVENLSKESKQQGNLSKAEEVMAKNLQVSLATRVGEVSAAFRKKQSSYLKKLRALSGMSSPGLDRAFSPVQGQNHMSMDMMESQADRSFSQSTLQQTALQRRGANDNVIAQREREIEAIATGIIELANIFQELQTMVIDQGTMLDRIDYNVDRTLEDVKGADKELKVATSYQKRSTKRKIILLLILIIAGMIILLVVRPGKRTSGAQPDQPLSPARPDPATPVGGPPTT